MKRVLTLLLAAAILMGMNLTVVAAERYNLTIGEGMTVYVSGRMVTEDGAVLSTDKVRVDVADESVKILAIDGKYYPVKKYFTVTGDLDFKNATKLNMGLAMVEGAQVRVGDVTLSDDGKLETNADSGLRFLATCDYADTVIADESIEFGIKVVAEGSDTPVYVKAEKFQNDENSVFTAAITNLSESNYNRKYTACAYALVPLFDETMLELNTACVERSIYQVSVGILKNSSAELEDNLPYTVDDAVKAVLAAYVNQTGIRLSYAKDGTMSARMSGNGAYTGDLFFNVTSNLNGDGSTAVTVVPLGETDGFFNAVTIPTWWKDYIRVNNNNSVATGYIYDEKIENGVLSFNFKLPEDIGYTFDQEDNVTIVTSVADGYINGIKAGEEVTYPLADTITMLGLAKSMDDVVPGSVIMVGYNSQGKVTAVELLASLGIPVNPDVFESGFGIHAAADGSSKYKNVVTEMYSKSGSKITDRDKVVYRFENNSSMCYRVGIAMSSGEPVITVTGNKISTYPSIFASTSEYHNYLYFRYNSETEKVKECVFYCVPKDLDFSGDGEYSDIFSLDDYVVIIE